MTSIDADKDAEGSSKPKRVRTGCLTCRERHLKCDEGLPNCNNCNKSNRTCKRGVRLNFIDTWVAQPPIIVGAHGDSGWTVGFQDESREIASEYKGGVQKYKPFDHNDQAFGSNSHVTFTLVAPQPSLPNMLSQPSQPPQSTISDPYLDPMPQTDMSNIFSLHSKQNSNQFQASAPNSGSTNDSHYPASNQSNIGPGSVGSFGMQAEELSNGDAARREFLDSPEETLFMQVFVEEVGLWMDSMDAQKHFSRLLPFHSLSEPMLLNAFLACGAKHLTLVNSAYTEEKALHYYDTATRFLLKNLQNPNRDTVICATTAVILNVYEIMSERALQRMNHIAGARALIKECGWSARAQGIGAACFWLNVGLEVMSCLHFNWQVAWDPDEWGVDMDFGRELVNGREEIWTQRMLYIIAKVCNFRATIPRHTEPGLRDNQIRTQQRYEQWSKLKGMADAWNDGIPRTMHPMAYIFSYHSASKSVFPEVWLIKRTTIVARLFYHTAMLLLAQTHPYYRGENMDMMESQTRHSQMICGIVAHVTDRGVASVAIRSLAHAAEVLTDRREQEEVIKIFEKINKETGWRIGFVYKELKDKWGWNEEPSPQQFAQTHTAAKQAKEAHEAAAERQRQLQEQAQAAQSMGLPHQNFANFDQQLLHNHSHPAPQQSAPAPAPAPAAKKMPQGIPNPMYAKADFSLPQHPYQSFYVAPNPNGVFGSALGDSNLYYGS